MLRSYFSLVVVLITLTSCGGGEAPDALKTKQTKLADLKSQVSQLNAEITTLEKEIATLDTTKKADRTRLVSVAPLAAQTFNHFIELQGSVVADQQIYVTPRMPGTITRVLVKTGDRVKQGQLLADMDDALMVQNKAAMQTQLDFASSLLQKQKSLWDQKIGTEVQYLQAKNGVESLQKQMALLDEQTQMLKIFAPISGTVDDVTMKVGQPGAPGNQFSSILIVNLSKLKVKAEVAEAYAGKLREGATVALNMPDIQRDMTSRISYVSKVISPLNRTFSVEIGLPGDSKDVIPNMITNVKIADYSHANAMVIPVNTVQRDLEGEFVYIAANNGGKNIAHKARIKVGQVFGDQAEILAGLKPGDRLVTVGFQDINEGEVLDIQ